MTLSCRSTNGRRRLTWSESTHFMPQRARSDLGVLLLLQLAASLGMHCFLPALPLFVAVELDQPLVWVGSVLAMVPVGAIASILIVESPRLRRVSSRALLLGGLCIRALGAGAHVAVVKLGVSSHGGIPLAIATLHLSSALHGASLGTGSVARRYLSTRLDVTERPRILLQLDVAAILGTGAGPVVGAALAGVAPTHAQGYAAPGWLTMFISLVSAVAILVCFGDRTRWSRRRGGEGEAAPAPAPALPALLLRMAAAGDGSLDLEARREAFRPATQFCALASSLVICGAAIGSAEGVVCVQARRLLGWGALQFAGAWLVLFGVAVAGAGCVLTVRSRPPAHDRHVSSEGSHPTAGSTGHDTVGAEATGARSSGARARLLGAGTPALAVSWNVLSLTGASLLLWDAGSFSWRAQGGLVLAGGSLAMSFAAHAAILGDMVALRLERGLEGLTSTFACLALHLGRAFGLIFGCAVYDGAALGSIAETDAEGVSLAQARLRRTFLLCAALACLAGGGTTVLFPRTYSGAAGVATEAADCRVHASAGKTPHDLEKPAEEGMPRTGAEADCCVTDSARHEEGPNLLTSDPYLGTHRTETGLVLL